MASDVAEKIDMLQPGFADILRAEELAWRSHWKRSSVLVKANRAIPHFLNKIVRYPEYSDETEIGEFFEDRTEFEEWEAGQRDHHAHLLVSLISQLHEDVVLLYYTCGSGVGPYCHVIKPHKGIADTCALNLDMQLVLEVAKNYGRRLMGRSNKLQFYKLLVRVTRMLLHPVRSHIDQASWLHFVAEGDLRQVEFQALPWCGRPLIASKQVSYANSITEMALQLSCPMVPESASSLPRETPDCVACVLAGPSKSCRRSLPNKDAAPWISRGNGLTDLVGAVCEGNVVQDMLGPNHVIYMLQGAELSYEQVCGLRDALDIVAEDLPTKILHVAAHFCLPEELEDDAYLALPFGSNLPSQHLCDAIPDSLDLCFWSVCSSGKLHAGPNDLVSLLAGKGCRFAVTTDWEIDDWAALLYTKSFYGNLRVHHNVLQACQAAQKEMLAMSSMEICDQARSLVSTYRCLHFPAALTGGSLPRRCSLRGADDSVETDENASVMLSAIQETIAGLQIKDAQSNDATEDTEAEEFNQACRSLPFWWASYRVYCNPCQNLPVESLSEANIADQKIEDEVDECQSSDEAPESPPTLLVPRLIPFETHVDLLISTSDGSVLCFTTEGHQTLLRRCQFSKGLLLTAETVVLPEPVLTCCEQSAGIIVAMKTSCTCFPFFDFSGCIWARPGCFFAVAPLPASHILLAGEDLPCKSLAGGTIRGGVKLHAIDARTGADHSGFEIAQAAFPSLGAGVIALCVLRADANAGAFKLVSVRDEVSDEPDLCGLDLLSGESWCRPCPPDESGHSSATLCRLDQNDHEGLLGSYFFVLRFNSNGDYLQQFNCITSCRQLALLQIQGEDHLFLVGHRHAFVVDWRAAQQQHERAFADPLASVTFHLEAKIDRDSGHRFGGRLWKYMGQEDLISDPTSSDSESDGSSVVAEQLSFGETQMSAEESTELDKRMKAQHTEVMLRHDNIRKEFTQSRRVRPKMG